jgi:glutamine synthetase
VNSKVADLCLSQVKLLPMSLRDATERMMRPESIAREPEVFGNSFVDHFGATRENEVALWDKAVTDWEGESRLTPLLPTTIISSRSFSPALL